MNFKIYDAIPCNNYDTYEYTLLEIKNLEQFKDLSFKIDDLDVNNELFITNTVVSVIFFDGSLPKRFIKDVIYDDNSNSLEVSSNKEDITFSTMDYRIHSFIIVMDKVSIKEFSLK